MKHKIWLCALVAIVGEIYAPHVLAASATVTWNANSESDLAGYKIYYGTSPRTGTDPKTCTLCGYSNSVNAGNVTSYNLSSLTDGLTYYFSVSAYDTSGNESSFSTEVSKAMPLTPDATAPTVSITAPSGGTVSGSVSFNASASDPIVSGQVNSGLKLITLSVDGSVFATSSSSSISKSLDTTTLTNASHTLTAVAQDNAGNQSSTASVTITVNNAAAQKFPRTVSLTGLEGLSAIPAGTTITATVVSPSSGSTLETQSNLTASAGKYTVTFLSTDPQLVNIRVKVNNYLSQLLTGIDTTANSAVALSVPQLLAGDNNNDNVVNSLDYSAMNSHWLQNYAAADINNDGLVNSLDFAVLKNNYNKSGQ